MAVCELSKELDALHLILRAHDFAFACDLDTWADRARELEELERAETTALEQVCAYVSDLEEDGSVPSYTAANVDEALRELGSRHHALRDTRDDLRARTEECSELRARVKELEEELDTVSTSLDAARRSLASAAAPEDVG